MEKPKEPDIPDFSRLEIAVISNPEMKKHFNDYIYENMVDGNHVFTEFIKALLKSLYIYLSKNKPKLIQEELLTKYVNVVYCESEEFNRFITKLNNTSPKNSWSCGGYLMRIAYTTTSIALSSPEFAKFKYTKDQILSAENRAEIIQAAIKKTLGF